ncbi:MAG: DNA-binding protein [Candidatus Lokiarchaeota archaeon]|nr:DNA-binding protein [Candidatus Lokiarchaeota archaeon]
MNVIKGKGGAEVIVLGIQPGELLLESIIQAIEKHDIHDGIVLSGIGTLKRCNLHYINHVDFPPSDTVYHLEQPLELLSVSGVIANKEPHLHAVVSCKEAEVHGGHLEKGCEVAYLAEISILKTNFLSMERRLDEARRVKLLGNA